MLDVRRMRMLREVARHGSFGGAARASRFRRRRSGSRCKLSSDAGAQLFDRGPGAARLTYSGRVLLDHAEVVLERLGHAEAELAAIARGEGGTLYFGSFPTGTESFVASAVRTFRARYPGVDLYFRDAEPYEHVLDLEALRCDCAVMFDFDGWPAARAYDGRLVSDRDDVVYEHLFDDPFLVALPVDHALATLDVVPIDRLADESILGSPLDCAPWGGELVGLCREGVGPGPVTAAAPRAAGRPRRHRPAPPRACARAPRKLGFPPTSYRSAACDAMVEILHETIEDHPMAAGAAAIPDPRL